jgi:thiol-disulfide isomerase/thioredoxin
VFNPLQHRVLIAGLLSPFAAAYLGVRVYGELTAASTDRNQDFVYRLTFVILAMIAPSIVTFALALWNRRSGMWSRSDRVGLSIAMLSLGLAFVPLRGLIGRMQQARNLAVEDVTAPQFETVDITGKTHRLQDHLGRVVLINAWATWCPPCREEMPLLDRLYQERLDDGLTIFGLSIEELELQQKFVKEQVPVSYPLLTINGNVPSLYKDIQRWPAFILIDRKGKLQPVPQAGEAFEKIEAAVDAALKDTP